MDDTMKNDIIEQVRQKALDLGVYRAEVVKVEDISLDAAFRAMCESNACGNYGRNYTCPPDAGDIHDLMKEIKNYSYALVCTALPQQKTLRNGGLYETRFCKITFGCLF